MHNISIKKILYFFNIKFINYIFIAAKKLPCNHIFHTSCLRSWFQRHQTCPTCRLDILRPTPPNRQSTAAANPAGPPPTRPAQATPSTSGAAAGSPNLGDGNSQGPTSSRPPAPGHPGSSIGNSYYNQTQFHRQFRQFGFQPPMASSNDSDINSNNNENNVNNDLPQQNNMNDFWASFINTAGQNGGIGIPSFFTEPGKIS